MYTWITDPKVAPSHVLERCFVPSHVPRLHVPPPQVQVSEAPCGLKSFIIETVKTYHILSLWFTGKQMLFEPGAVPLMGRSEHSDTGPRL